MLKITSGKITRAVKCCIYGSEGIGKSTFASKFPDPLFVDTEGGTAQLDVRRIDKPQSWPELLTIVMEIAKTPDVCKTMVIDTADWAEKLCIDYICEKYKIPSIESAGYGKGYTYLAEEWSKMLKMCDLCIDHGKHVVIVAHAKMRKFEQPESEGAYDRWEMKLTRQVAPLVKEWADMLLFLNYRTNVVKSDTGTTKVQGGKRVMYTSHHACWDAKNRHGLPDILDMDYSQIAHIFGEVKTVKPIDKLKELLANAGITEAQLQAIVASKGHYPENTHVDEYRDSFVDGWCIKYFDKIVEMINAEKNSNELEESLESESE